MDFLFAIVVLVLVLIPIVLWFWSGVWAHKDAKRRGKPPMLVALLVMLVGWPFSLLVWIALRPEDHGPPFNLDDYRVQ